MTLLHTDAGGSDSFIAVVGGVIGSLIMLLLVAIIFIVFLCIRQYKR